MHARLQGDGRGTAALVALGRHDLVVEGSQVLYTVMSVSKCSPIGGCRVFAVTYHSNLRPGGNVVREGDGAAGALGRADAQVLVEGLGALDGRGVAADDLVDVCQTGSAFTRLSCGKALLTVSAAVGGQAALEGAGRARVVGAVVFDHVVLNKGRGLRRCEQYVLNRPSKEKASRTVQP